MAVDYKKKNRNQNIVLFVLVTIFIICYFIARMILNNDFFVTVLILIVISVALGTLVWYFTTEYIRPHVTISDDSIKFLEKNLIPFSNKKSTPYKISYSDIFYVLIMSDRIFIQMKGGYMTAGKNYLIMNHQIDNVVMSRKILLQNLASLKIRVIYMNHSSQGDSR